jgi:hypothetical protein
MVKSGWEYSFGLGFWGPNGHDGVWHIALAESLARGSGDMPVFAGMPLQNYHLGFDLILALINKLTFLSTNFLYFQALPPILALLVGYLTYKFVFLWRRSRVEAWWATFFVYFGGSFGWRGESMFWSQQSISTLVNPPFALSLVLILSGLILTFEYLQEEKVWSMILAGIFFGVLVEIKVYAGILVLAGLFVALLWRFNSAKKLAGVLAIASIFSLALFILFERGAASLIVFQPFWFLETMMGLTDRLGWLTFASAMATYRSGGIWPKAILAYSVAFIVFLVGNLGTRIISLWHLRKIPSLSWIEAFFLTVIFLGIAFPMFFLQAGTPWNTIQFFYYSLVFLGIFAGVSVAELVQGWQRKICLGYILEAVVIILTLPTTLMTLSQVYLPGRPPAMLPSDEVRALSFLSQEPLGIVLTYPFDRLAAKEAEGSPPRPLYLYESSAYVSAYSNKPTFLEDEVNLDITGYAWKERRKEVEEFYREPDAQKARDFLKSNNIEYIYWIGKQRALLGETQLGLQKIFENLTVNIYRVE